MTARRLVHVFTVATSLDFLRGQVRHVGEQGFDVHVIAAPDGPLLARFAEAERATPHEVPMTREITPLKDLRSLVRLWRLMRDLAPDIVHASTPKGGLLGTLAAFLNRVPIRIYHIHGIRGMTETGWRRFILLSTERLACALSTRVLCVSASTRESALQAGLCAPNKIVVLSAGSCNGVDAHARFNLANVDELWRKETRDRLALPPGARVLGFVGRLVRDKGILELVEAWQTLKEQYADLHLLIIGPTEAHDPLPMGTMSDLRGDPRVRLVDTVADPAPYYSIMDVLTLPSYREGLPNVLLEAAAMKVPVVATRVAGCVDAVLDGVTGTLVPARSAGAVAEAVDIYLRSPALCLEHGANGRERVLRDFKPEQIWEGVLALYASEVKARLRSGTRGSG